LDGEDDLYREEGQEKQRGGGTCAENPDDGRRTGDSVNLVYFVQSPRV
jgi:hypothetical protein